MSANGRDETRQRVVRAARELFAENGFDNTTVREIADRVGLSDGALYYYFKSKREILLSVWEVPEGGGIESMRPNGELTPARLDEIVKAMFQMGMTNSRLFRLMNREVLSGDRTASALRAQNRAVLRKVLYDHIVTLFPPAESEVRAEAALAVITGASMQYQIRVEAGLADEPPREFVGGLQRRVRQVVFAGAA